MSNPTGGVGINGQQAGRHERASIGWRLDDCLVQQRVDVEQGRPRVRVEIVVRIAGTGDAGGGGAGNVVQRRVGLGLARQRASKRVPEVLASVADDPQSVGGSIKVYAKKSPSRPTVNGDTGVAAREGTTMLQRQLGHLMINRIVESEFADFNRWRSSRRPHPRIGPHKGWLQPRAIDPVSGNLIFPMQSFLVRTRHHTILVDTCVGHKKRQRPSWNMTTSGKFLADLAAAGIRPDAVDYVLCTHLHVDHVGWNTQLRDGRWVPTFPNAKHIFSRQEWDYWAAVHQATPLEHITDSVLPIAEAGQAVFVANDYALHDEVWLEPTAGHTPNHVSVHLASNAGLTPSSPVT